MEIPLPDSICHHRCQFVKTGFSNPARMDAVASNRRPLSLVAYRFRKLARRALLPTAGNVTSGDSTQYANQYIRLAVKLLMRRIQRMEAGDCRGFLQTGRLGREVRPVRFEDRTWEIATHRNKPEEAASWLRSWLAAAVSFPALCARAPFAPSTMKENRARCSASPRSRSKRTQPLKQLTHTSSCAVDDRNVLAVTSQRLAIPDVCSI
jgi:hypothetical protein